MKKNLKVSGKVLFERADMIKMISEVLHFTEDLQLERIIAVDENGEAVKVDSFICYVHQTKSDEIPDKYDPEKTINMKNGFNRPNYGIGRSLRYIFEYNTVHKLDDLFNSLKTEFPLLTKDRLKRYLTRPEMTGCELIIEGNEYWNPKGIKTEVNYETSQTIR